MEHLLKPLAPHGGCKTMAESHRQRCENPSDIDVGYVIGNHQGRTAKPTQIFPPFHARSGEEISSRPNQQVIDREAYACHQPALSPLRITVFAARSGRFL